MRPIAVPTFELGLQFLLNLYHLRSLVLSDLKYILQVEPLYFVQATRDCDHWAVVEIPG